MSFENQFLEKKSLRKVVGANSDWRSLLPVCVGFANSFGGRLWVGIEDKEDLPPEAQRIDSELLNGLRRKIEENTVNVSVLASIENSSNGGEYIVFTIPRSSSVASTTDGRYFKREADYTKPVTGDGVLRLATDRVAFSWELQTRADISREQTDPDQCDRLVAALRASERVNPSVKEKSDDEILDHYQLFDGPHLTNLGVLCVGRQKQRAALGSAPVIQCTQFDSFERKVNKLLWDDYTLSPVALVDAVWKKVPVFRESYELPSGLYRQHVPAFDEVVVRELLVNALVHRPYTQRGDIFINLYPDRMEVVNPGLLPEGVTPTNILHKSVRRNDGLARLFFDLKLMEREGSGYEKLYETLLSQGRAIPEVVAEHDYVKVIVYRRIIRPEVIDFLAKADAHYDLTQRERISLGLLAQHDALTARELAEKLELSDPTSLRSWLGRLTASRVVQSAGRTQGMRYFVSPSLLRNLDFPSITTLTRIEPHRLEALILEDLRRYPSSSIGEIQKRIGKEIPIKQVKRSLSLLIQTRKVSFEGVNRWRRYQLAS